MHVHSSLPKMSTWIRFLLDWVSLHPKNAILQNRERLFQWQNLTFPFSLTPQRFGEAVGCWGGGGTRVPEGTASCNARPSLPIYDL